MANNYVTETKDSFKGKTTVESYKLNYQLNPRKLTLSENADFSIRHVSTPTIEGTIFTRKKVDGANKHLWKAEVTESDSNTAIISAWYDSVYEPTYATNNGGNN